jgi:hypothetical protein
MCLLFTSLITSSANVSVIAMKCRTQLSSHSAFPVLHSPQRQRRTEAMRAIMSKYLISSTARSWVASISRPLPRHLGHFRTNSHFNISARAAPPSPLAFDRLRRTTDNGWIASLKGAPSWMISVEFQHTTRNYISEEKILHSHLKHCRANLRSEVVIVLVIT